MEQCNCFAKIILMILVIALLALTARSTEVVVNADLPSKREAYAALFYGRDEGFLLGLRVLGQSLQESGTTRDMVALCLPDVSSEVKFLLSREGWHVYPINPKDIKYEGPYAGHVAKLAVLTLTQYKKIVLIDTDVIAYKGADDIFNCGSYCASMRHSNIFNTGVMVLTPSQMHFTSIINMLEHWDPMEHSHKGGDQDILNVYFRQIVSAVTYNKSDPNYQPPMFAQLPYEYNMDAGMYYLRGRWLINRKDYRFLHYTLGPVKPWQWLFYPLSDLHREWQEYRFRMKEPTKEMFTPFSRYLPFYMVALLFFLRLASFQSFHRHIALRLASGAGTSDSSQHHQSSASASQSRLKRVLIAVYPVFIRFYKVIIVSLLAISLLLALSIVPQHLRPFTGWVMFLFSFFVFEAHVFELTFVICYYGNASCLDNLSQCGMMSSARNQRHHHRPPFRAHNLHIKFVLASAIFILIGLYILPHISFFWDRFKFLITWAVLFIIFIMCTCDYLVRVYTQGSCRHNVGNKRTSDDISV